jgi:hydrogenase 3 maturation protease
MNFEEVRVSLAGRRPDQIAFVGLGNPYRGDDAAGLILFDRLKNSPALMGARFIRAEANPENHLQEILDGGAGLVVFIDAARFGGRPGEIVWVEEDRIDSASVSTHSFSLRVVTDFLRLHRPFVFKVLAIQSGATGFGAALSPAVRLGVEAFFFPS